MHTQHAGHHKHKFKQILQGRKKPATGHGPIYYIAKLAECRNATRTLELEHRLTGQ